MSKDIRKFIHSKSSFRNTRCCNTCSYSIGDTETNDNKKTKNPSRLLRRISGLFS
nr:MAG TPA: hypothetical protein [Caudoviricetes sp.]